MKNYLSTPCPKCNSCTLNQPHQTGYKWYSFCDTCEKNAGVKRYWNEVLKIYEFQIYRAGRRGEGLFLSQRMHLETWCEGLSAGEIRRYLRAGKIVLDKRESF